MRRMHNCLRSSHHKARCACVKMLVQISVEERQEEVCADTDSLSAKRDEPDLEWSGSYMGHGFMHVCPQAPRNGCWQPAPWVKR